ncbi:MAG: hypothetical protein J6K73_12015 [Clostridia bacterium]|nr:hypothetical protein [Clostridia bacterium]MBP3650496.1 hypothetical protein [Clostridia bacterium]
MKRINWLALLVATLMLFGFSCASAEGTAVFPEDTGTDILWLMVPWEDMERQVLFGIHMNNAHYELSNVRVEIDILEKGTDAWNAQYAMLDAANQAVADDNGLMLMDISLFKPTDSSANQAESAFEPFHAENLNLTLYIHGQKEWDYDEIRFCHLADAADEEFSLKVLEDVYNGPELDDYTTTGKYLSVHMTHFSPFVVFNTKAAASATATPTPGPVATPTPAPAASASPVQPPAAAPATGDAMQPLLWGVLFLGSVAAVSLLLLRKRNAR